MTKYVSLTIDQRGVASVCLNNPDKHNAFDDQIIAELSKCFDEVAANNSIRAMVLRSEGRSFSAGADLNWMKRMVDYSLEENARDSEALATMLSKLNQLSIPTIARVQGAAFGGAVGLVSCCDMAVGSTRASFSLSEVKIGLIPATISPYVLAAIGPRASRRYFLSGERFSAETALSLGLLSEVCDEATLDHKIDLLLKDLLANSPQALLAAKKLIQDYAHRDIDDALIADSCQRIAEIRVSPEGQEGLSAFLEKRSPQWIQE